MKFFGGKILFLDRNDINTDEIIPAKYLSGNSKEELKPRLLEDLKLDGFDPGRDIPGKGAVVARANFGCGSSREHAPWALEANGINIVIAESFARIFRQNMYNCGMIACELSSAVLDELFAEFANLDTELSVVIERNQGQGSLCFKAAVSSPKEKNILFALDGFERAMIEAGGWLQYAEKRYDAVPQ
jgi:3-isopropylmalate/(R)-2-methylmalate dehydratase small subunit